MCITMAGKGNTCLDMCDTKIPLDTFHDTPGKQAGTVGIVEQVRAGRDPAGFTTCPGPSVWLWLWIPLLLCCAVGFCALAYFMFNYYRGRLKRSVKNRGYSEPEEPYVEDGPPYADYNQGLPQQEADFQQMPPPQDDRDVALEPMPVIDQTQYPAEPLVEVPIVTGQAAAPNLFGGAPDLMAGLAPATVAMAAPAPLYAGMAAPLTTAGSSYAPYTVAPGALQTVSPMYGGSMAVQPTYGAYGAYGTTYPTGSMRIG